LGHPLCPRIAGNPGAQYQRAECQLRSNQSVPFLLTWNALVDESSSGSPAGVVSDHGPDGQLFGAGPVVVLDSVGVPL
jgi:hypothetical protein